MLETDLVVSDGCLRAIGLHLGVLADQHRRQEIRVHDPRKLLIRRALQKRRLRDARAIDQDVHRPNRLLPLCAPRKDALDARRVRHIQLEKLMVAGDGRLGIWCLRRGLWRRLQLALETLALVDGGAGKEGYDGAVAGKGLGDVGADDAGGADDGGVLAGEAEGHGR